MKSFLMTAVTALLSFGLVTVASADTPQGGAAQLLIPEAQPTETAQDGTERLNTLANQINQDVSGEQPQDEAETASPLDSFQLPDGLVIRGSTLGGVTVGTEL